MRGDSATCSGTRKRFGIAGDGGTSTFPVGRHHRETARGAILRRSRRPHAVGLGAVTNGNGSAIGRSVSCRFPRRRVQGHALPATARGRFGCSDRRERFDEGRSMSCHFPRHRVQGHALPSTARGRFGCSDQRERIGEWAIHVLPLPTPPGAGLRPAVASAHGR
jgi:hypothetical protein